MASKLETDLAFQLTAVKLIFNREYRFNPNRRWRFDFAFPDKKIAVECEGGTWMNGRHNRGYGIQADMEKYNNAAIRGWRILRFTSQDIKSGFALECIEEILNG